MSAEGGTSAFGPGAVLGDRYRLERRIATGGMATVWLARDTQLDRDVAVKVLSDVLADNPSYTKRFRREARVAARLSDPNLVRIFDYSGETERPYIVMEHIPGGTLADQIAADQAGEVDPDRLARELLGALAAIHAAGVVHRDVKPSNVLLDGAGRAHLTDFGIAQPEDATQLTGTGEVIGTLKYMAPEILAGRPATERSDLYALGVVLAECLAGGVAPQLEALIDRLTATDPAGAAGLGNAGPEAAGDLRATCHDGHDPAGRGLRLVWLQGDRGKREAGARRPRGAGACRNPGRRGACRRRLGRHAVRGRWGQDGEAVAVADHDLDVHLDQHRHDDQHDRGGPAHDRGRPCARGEALQGRGKAPQGREAPEAREAPARAGEEGLERHDLRGDPALPPRLVHRDRDPQVLDREAGGVEKRDLIVRSPPLGAAQDHVAELRHVLPAHLPRGYAAGQLTAGRRLRPLVAEETAALERRKLELGLALGVGAQRGQMLAGAQIRFDDHGLNSRGHGRDHVLGRGLGAIAGPPAKLFRERLGRLGP